MKKDAPHITFVSDREKDLLWDQVTAHFGLPGNEATKNLVKKLGSQEDGHTIPELEEEAV
jgi:hypothetical protein